MDKKRCPKCNLTKEAGDFYKDRLRKDGLQFYCKDCKNGYESQRPNFRQGNENDRWHMMRRLW